MSSPAQAPLRWRWAAAVAAAGYTLALFTLSAQPLGPGSLDFPWRFTHDDKLVHAALYSVLGGLLRIARGRRSLAALGGSAVGAIDEWWVQASIPERHADPFDVAADAAGALIGALIAHRWLHQRRRAARIAR